MALAGIDEEHLAGPNLATTLAVVEMERPRGHDHGHGNRVAVLGNVLPGLQAQPDDPHRSAVGDLLEADRAPRPARPRFLRGHVDIMPGPTRSPFIRVEVRHALG